MQCDETEMIYAAAGMKKKTSATGAAAAATKTNAVPMVGQVLLPAFFDKRPTNNIASMAV